MVTGDVPSIAGKCQAANADLCTGCQQCMTAGFHSGARGDHIIYQQYMPPLYGGIVTYRKNMRHVLPSGYTVAAGLGAGRAGTAHSLCRQRFLGNGRYAFRQQGGLVISAAALPGSMQGHRYNTADFV